MFSYNIPHVTDIDKVRMLIQDTNIDDYSFQDEEIETYLSLFGSVIQASIMICYSYATKFAVNSNEEFEVDDIRVKEGKDKANNFLKIAKQLEKRIESGFDISEGAAIHFGGIYERDISSNREDQTNNIIVDNPFYNGVLDTDSEETIIS